MEPWNFAFYYDRKKKSVFIMQKDGINSHQLYLHQLVRFASFNSSKRHVKVFRTSVLTSLFPLIASSCKHDISNLFKKSCSLSTFKFIRYVRLRNSASQILSVLQNSGSNFSRKLILKTTNASKDVWCRASLK